MCYTTEVVKFILQGSLPFEVNFFDSDSQKGTWQNYENQFNYLQCI